MTTEPDCWEVGSLFHLADFEPRGAPEEVPWAHGLLTGCGRDALRLVAKLARHRRWWIPSYFCQEVVRSVLNEGIELLIYPDSPLDDNLDLAKIDGRPGDAILVVNYFGLRGADDVLIPEGFAAEIIEDHTHAPSSAWARTSKADFCFSSLRKLYPLADGGALWSPVGHSLPATPRLTSELQMGAFEKLTGMVLKRLYLQGHPITKQEFRPMLESGEQKLLGSEISTMTQLSRATLAAFPLTHWHEIQRSNFNALVQQAPSSSGFRNSPSLFGGKRSIFCVLRLRGGGRLRAHSCSSRRKPRLSLTTVAHEGRAARWRSRRAHASLRTLVLHPYRHAL